MAQTPYQQVILNHPTFRAQYNAILTALLDPATGPLSVTALHSFLNNVEAVVTPALVNDPYSGITSNEAAQALFNALRSWVTDRVANVQAQVAANQPPPRH